MTTSIGLIGVGNIGGRVGRRLVSTGERVIAYDVDPRAHRRRARRQHLDRGPCIRDRCHPAVAPRLDGDRTRCPRRRRPRKLMSSRADDRRSEHCLAQVHGGDTRSARAEERGVPRRRCVGRCEGSRSGAPHADGWGRRERSHAFAACWRGSARASFTWAAPALVTSQSCSTTT